MAKSIQLIFLLLIHIFLAACATTKPPVSYTPGARVNTLSTLVSLSVNKGDQGMGASGYLLYQRPDQMRMVILSPFGTTIMEVFLVGDNITIVDISKSIAFSGLIADLPEKGAGENWRHARLLMDIDGLDSGPKSGTMERISKAGLHETITFENGLVVSRRMPNGDEVIYNDYAIVNGVPLASEIIMHSESGGRFRIKISEPEVNGELSADAFSPKLDGLTIYPLEALQQKP